MSRRKRRRAKSTIVKHSIFIDGHRTSASLEDAFWKGLKESAGVRRMNLSKLVALHSAAFCSYSPDVNAPRPPHTYTDRQRRPPVE